MQQSKNGTFLFDRNYMDYHSDRFRDHSLLFYLKKKLYAVLPANTDGNTLHTHQGLTYGGLVCGNHATAENTMCLLSEMNALLKAGGINRVVYKAVPWIYHSMPAEEDLYAITNLCGARLTARSISSAILLSEKPRFSQLRRRGAKKAAANGLAVGESNDIAGFWNILADNLTNKYGVKPVHTEGEITLLKSRFPHNIKLYTATKDGRTVGGVLLYITGRVVHSQYIAADGTGKEYGALDLLFDYLINDIYAGHRFFDFGISTEDGGKTLNRSLIFQKEGFGGRGICYDTYEWTL